MIKFYKNIHLPASYYFSSGYIPEFAQQLLKGINLCEKEGIFITKIIMNDNTYNWMFRIFNFPTNNGTYPLDSYPSGKYLYDYPIMIVNNNELEDGLVIYYTGEDNAME